MFSARWLLFAVTLLLLFIQLANACAFAKRATDDPAPKRAVVRRTIKFPDTNVGKIINKGGRPRNKTCKKWFEIRDVILRDIFNGTTSHPLSLEADPSRRMWRPCSCRRTIGVPRWYTGSFPLYSRAMLSPAQPEPSPRCSSGKDAATAAPTGRY
jgi:hypothetical protein